MKAAAAARQRWAWRRSAAPPGGLSEAPPMPGRTVALVTTVLLIALAAAVIACAAIGFNATQRDDSRLEAERHAALQKALDDMRPVLGEGDDCDAGKLASIGGRAGLSDLRFDADFTADSSREVQTMQDAQGRIVGWFSWAPDRSLVRAMDQLWAAVGMVGVALAICAVFALRATRRLIWALGRSTVAVNRLMTQD